MHSRRRFSAALGPVIALLRPGGVLDSLVTFPDRCPAESAQADRAEAVVPIEVQQLFHHFLAIGTYYFEVFQTYLN